MPAYPPPFHLTHSMIARMADIAERVGARKVAQRRGCSARTVERAAARLQAEGRLRYVGPKKGGHSDVL